MHSFLYVATAAILAHFATAQSLQDLQALPQCAQTPAETAFAATGCGLNEPACVCKNADFQTSLTNEVMKDCSQTDQIAVLKFSTNFCAKAGITVNVPQTTAASAQAALNPTPAPASSAAPPPPPPPPPSSSAPAPLASSSAISPPPPPASSSSSTIPVASSTLYPTTSSSVVAYNGSNSSAYGGTVLSFTGSASMTSASVAMGLSAIASILAAFVL